MWRFRSRSTHEKFFNLPYGLAIQIFNNFKDINQKISDFNHISLINSNAHPNFTLIEKKIDEKSKKLRNFILIDQIRDQKLLLAKNHFLN